VKERSVQFSLRSMFVCCVVGAVFLALNLRTTVTTGEIVLSIDFPPGTPGDPNMMDWILIERGFPLSYQQSREMHPHGTLDSTLNRISTLTPNLWTVTHSHWLFLDLVFGLSMITLCVWSIPFAIRTLRWSCSRRLSTNQRVHGSSGDQPVLKSMSTPAAP